MNQPPVWNQARAGELEALCRQFRVDVLTTLHKVGTGHPGGSLSVCEILAVLYLQCANISPDNWEDPDRDRVVLTKGHAALTQSAGVPDTVQASTPATGKSGTGCSSSEPNTVMRWDMALHC